MVSRRAMMTTGVAAAAAVAAGCAWWWRRRADTGPRGGAAAEAHWAERRAELCSGRNAVGVGLRGEYFRVAPPRGAPLLTRLDPVIDFAPDLEMPPALSGRAVGSVRWSGWIKAPLTGRYRFHLDVPGARVLVSQRAVLADGSAEPVEMSAGRFYPIQVEVQVPIAASSPRLRLEWTAPHGARYLVPRALLYQPTETARS